MSRNFSPVAWCNRTNLYEVNIRQYTPEGTFKAFAKHLPRLKEMGVETLWLMPITPISVDVRQGTLGSYYACSDYTAINPEFGTLDDFRDLVKLAHDMGMKLIIDWVANHTGWDHIWTQTHPEYYKKTAEGKFYDTNNWHDVIDLNYYDGGMRKAMIEAMQFWVLDADIDGFRCDMAHLVPLDFWRDARKAVDKLKPVFWLAETEDMHYLDVFDTCYAWQWMHDTEKYARGQNSLQSLRELLERYSNEWPAGTFPLFFTSNHDENSWNGTEYEKFGELAPVLAVLSHTWKGMPLIYSGQEIPNHKRLAFFDKDLIEWKGTPALQEFYKALLSLRKNHPALSADNTASPVWIPTNADNYILSFVRRTEGKEILVLLNLSPNHLFVQFAEGYVYGDYTNVFTKQTVTVIPQQSFELKPFDYLVLLKA
ncbi:MAG: alpha-glucosidase C-terminal domain-containing protein [Chitinophagaceae bacterium]|nr:alpha-glucosidase C-terminal domain-containing protein [Chitinophagaceae bacterium]